jgi:ferrous iron transport protein A
MCNNTNYSHLEIFILINMISLNSLHPGQNATIHAIEAEDSLFQRLAALGFRIGKKIELVRRASFNGPVHVRMGTTDIILRLSEARRIQITH